MNATTVQIAISIATLLLAFNSGAQNRVDAPLLLEQAAHVKMVEGDLDRVASLYRQVATSPTASRSDVALALVALGNTYELQGSQEAVATYERVVSEFADQPESFMTANSRLTSLAAAPGAATDGERQQTGGDYTLVLQNLHPSGTRSPRTYDFSPDGETLLYYSLPTSERKKQFPALRFETYIRDTGGSVSRPLMEDADDWEFIGGARWSRDGKKVCFSVSGSKSRQNGGRQFWLFDVETQHSRQLEGDFFKNDRSGRYAEWMPDNNSLVIQFIDGFRVMGLDGVERKYFPEEYHHLTRMGGVSPDGRYLLFHKRTADKEDQSEMDIWQLDLETGASTELTSDPGYEGWPAWSLDGTEFYYVSGPEAARNIFRRKPGSSEPPIRVTAYSNSSAAYPRILPKGGQLTFALIQDNHVIFTADTNAMDEAANVVRGSKAMLSPDGTYIYYIDNQPGHIGLWKISHNGDNPRQLVSGRVLTSYAVKSLLSPDGETIAYAQHAGDTTSLFTMSSDGGEASRLYSVDGVRHLIPSWSPDNTEIAFSIDGDMMVIPATGGDATVLASVTDWESWNLEWSPDGKSIAGFAYLEGERSNHLMVVDRATGQISRATPPEEENYKEILAWHPDGDRISYMYYNPVNRNGSRVVNLKTKEISDLVNMPDPNWDYVGAWGPDKRYYFISVGRGSLGNWGLYAFNESSAEYQQIRQYPDRGMSLPTWSADGTRIAWSEETRVRQLWMMTNYE